jgi:predicted AlkP superfamily phosphohydrolase/phosphomutase
MNIKNTQDSAYSKLLIVGIDAADRHLILDWSSRGLLPNFDRLMQQASWGDSGNSTGMVAGTVWPTFYTGVLPGRTGRFRGTTQFVSGTYEHADIDLPRDDFPPFWDVLAEQGVRSYVVDAPYAFLSTKEQVTQVVDWCSHSAWKDGVTISRPAELAAAVREEFGRDSIGKCDFTRLTTFDDHVAFRDNLIQRIQIREELLLQTFESHDVDLYVNVFSECHCAGHHLWHLHDASHPLHDAELVSRLGGDPLQAVYQAMDSTLGRIMDSLPPGFRLLVFCSHGIGPAYTGTHLLDEVLLKLEGLRSPKKRQGVAQNMVGVWTKLPQWVRTTLTPLQKKLWPKLKASLVQPRKAKRRFFEIIVNDASAGVRLNVIGREPDGVVEAGQEYEDICNNLECELLALRDPASHQKLVSKVIRTSHVYPGPKTAHLPDLLVVWNRDHGPITSASSETIGHVNHRFVFTNHRTGDHTEDDGLFFLTGPGVESGRLNKVSVADLPPTIVAMLGGELKTSDGRVVAELLGEDLEMVSGQNA